MNTFIKLFLSCALPILISSNAYAATTAGKKKTENITVVYSGDIQGKLLPSKV